MEVDPRNLRYLHAIARHGTFTRAAEAEGISQPALSNKISQLEHQLGARLLDRGRQGAHLNTYGQLLIRHARAIDAVIDRASAEIKAAKQGDSGPLIVGGTPISMVSLVPKALALLTESDPRLSVAIHEADDDLLLDKLRGGEIELMLGGMVVGQQSDDILEMPLADFPIQAVVGRTSRFWGRQSIELRELVEEPLALPDTGSVIRRHVEAIFIASGTAMPTNHWSCSSMHALKSVVQHSQRVSLMPVHSFSLEERAGVMQGIRLIGTQISRRLNLMRLRHIPESAVAGRFATALTQAASELG